MARFVLVPGAWLGAWVWERVTPLLERDGHTAVPVTLTGMGDRVHLAGPTVGMPTAVEDVLQVIRFQELDDVTLVGHSFAGKVVAAVADRLGEQVSRVIYLDALRPERVRDPQAGFDATREFGKPPEGVQGVPLTEEIIGRIGPDLSPTDRQWMLEFATPWPFRLASDPITLSERYDRVSESYVFCRRSGDPVDEIVAGKWGKLEGPYRLLDAGHWPMVSRPTETAEALVGLAR